jgi:hypothetical protein
MSKAIYINGLRITIASPQAVEQVTISPKQHAGMRVEHVIFKAPNIT